MLRRVDHELRLDLKKGQPMRCWCSRVHVASLAAALYALLLPCKAEAGGFYLPTQSGSSIGLATAGSAARAQDGTTVFYNPAGMTALGRGFVEGGGFLTLNKASIRDTGSAAATPGTLGAPVPLTGDPHGEPFAVIPVPNQYAAQPWLGGTLWLGLAVTAPFGSAGKYQQDWFGRYDSIETTLTVLDVAPSLAYRVTDSLSVGGGIDVQYAYAKLVSALPNTLNPGGPTPSTDGRSVLEGDDWSVGFNVGIWLRLGDATRVGLHYRSGIMHRLEGTAEVSGLTGPLSAANGTSRASADLDLPGFVTLGVAHKLTPALTVLGEFQWFNWQTSDELRVKFANGQADLVRPQHYRNTVAVAVGVEYALTERWTLRSGVRFDETPTRDNFRSSSFPDSNYVVAAIGAGYAWGSRLVLDVGYAHGFFFSDEINLTQTFFEGTPAAATINTRGRTDVQGNSLSLTLRYHF
jgi:long-chain fatty acid transport protein